MFAISLHPVGDLFDRPFINDMVCNLLHVVGGRFEVQPRCLCYKFQDKYDDVKEDLFAHNLGITQRCIDMKEVFAATFMDLSQSELIIVPHELQTTERVKRDVGRNHLSEHL